MMAGLYFFSFITVENSHDRELCFKTKNVEIGLLRLTLFCCFYSSSKSKILLLLQ